MTATGLTHGARLACIILAVGVHAAAAAAFMLAPAKEPPPPPPGVEIEMLAEITSVVAEEVTPSVAAEAQEVEEASEAREGEAQSQDGEEAGKVAAIQQEESKNDTAEVKETEQPKDQPEAEVTPEAETPPTEQAALSMPVEMEAPVIEAPAAPVLAPKPKPAAKQKKKEPKSEKRRAMTAASMVTRDARQKGTSAARISGGSQSSSEYRSIVIARISARRPAISAGAGSGVKGRVIIAFSIGANGRVTSASVSKSSGNARLDSVARSAVASTSFPPPPSGSFRGGIPIAIVPAN